MFVWRKVPCLSSPKHIRREGFYLTYLYIYYTYIHLFSLNNSCYYIYITFFRNCLYMSLVYLCFFSSGVYLYFRILMYVKRHEQL